MKRIASTLLLSVLAAGAFAQATPVGLWKTIDDETKAEKSLVRVTDEGGVITGRIEKLLDPAKQNDVCDKCTDDRKDKPILGMTVGDITDPKNGKVYRARMKPVDGGKTLEVRGYIGPFYRNQTWIRVE